MKRAADLLGPCRPLEIEPPGQTRSNHGRQHRSKSELIFDFVRQGLALGPCEDRSEEVRVLVRKFWIDEIYGVLLVRPLVAISDRLLYRGIDAGLIDGVLVNGVARSIRALATNGLRYLQSGLVQAYMLLMLVGAIVIVALMMR